MAPSDRDRDDEVQDPPVPEHIRGEAEEPPPIDHASVAPLTTEDDTEGG